MSGMREAMRERSIDYQMVVLFNPKILASRTDGSNW